MRWLRLSGLVIISLVLVATPALGHAFLVDTRPGQGERLTRAPSEVVVQFTEAVVPGSVEVELTDEDGTPLPKGGTEMESEDRVVRVRLPEPVEGVVVASWQVVSASDGHETAGELAFAVGESGALPISGGAELADTSETVWRWLLVTGLSLGVGALVASTTGQIALWRGIRWGRVGLAVAAIGPAMIYATCLAEGISPSTIAAGGTALLLVLAALSIGRTSQSVPPILAFAGVVAWASRSHAATATGMLGTIADAAHLGGAALWFGTLTLLVFDLWRARREGDSLFDAARLYSRWALRAVLVLAVAGLVSAVSLLTTLSDLWTTGYGRLLLIKVGLFGLAVSLAAASRWRALSAGSVRLLRRLTTVEVVVVAVVVVASGILAATSPPTLAQSDETLLGPPPIEGPVTRAAGLAGNMTVGAQAGDGRLDLRVYNSSTGGIEDAQIESTAALADGTGVDLHPRPCGAGCFTQQFLLSRGTTTIEIGVTSQEWTDGTAQLDLVWPPPHRQPELLDQVITSMREVDQLTVHETVNSGPGAEASSSSTLTGDAFIDLEVYANADLDQVTPLPDENGIRLYLPGARILIDLRLNDQDRIVHEWIASPGHVIIRDITYP